MVTRKRAIRSQEEDVVERLKASLDDAENLLREAADATGDKASELREDALRALRRTRDGLHDTQEELMARGREAVRATDDYVHDKPWQAIGMAGLAGLLLGVLLTRR